jgi:hypothetical protein
MQGGFARMGIGWDGLIQAECAAILGVSAFGPWRLSDRLEVVEPMDSVIAMESQESTLVFGITRPVVTHVNMPAAQADHFELSRSV